MGRGRYRVSGARWAIFNLVGAVGLLVQLGCLWVLKDGLGVHYALAALISIELTVVHNFFWHIRWTWADRLAVRGASPASHRGRRCAHLARRNDRAYREYVREEQRSEVGCSAGRMQPDLRRGLLTSTVEVLRRLARFNLTNGTISIVGNLVLMAALVELARVHYLVANLLSVTACSLANFVVSDVVVFEARTLAVLCTVVGWLGTAGPAHAADLRTETARAFERYVRLTEARMDDEVHGTAPFLWVDRLPARERAEVYGRLHRGEIVVSRLKTRDAGRAIDVSDGMCHHWVGTIFAPRARLDQAVRLMQSYDRYHEIYRPAVRRSRTLSRAGNRFTVYLQLFTKKVISVVLNTEYDVSYIRVAPTRMSVRSASTRIAEVQRPDTADEQEKPVGHDNGFLWRFNNYCALEERGEGVYIQCESVSLTRNIPTGLGWLIGPFVTSIPKESLEFTLGTMRAALTK